MQAAAILIPVRPCIKCEATERDPHGNCRACARVAAKRWYEDNKDKALANMRAWQAANPEKFKASNIAWAKANLEKIKAYRRTPTVQAKEAKAARAWRNANPEKFKAAMAAWRVKNPLKIRVYVNNHRAKELNRDGKLSSGLIAKLFSLQQGTCPCCSQPLGNDFHMDHIVALHNGGPNIDDNIQLLRSECNGNKRIQDPIAFMQSRGFLL